MQAGMHRLRLADYHVLCSAITPPSSLWTLTLAARIIVRDYNPTVEGHLDSGLHYEYRLAKVT
jgi:hypothetical protein